MSKKLTKHDELEEKGLLEEMSVTEKISLTEDAQRTRSSTESTTEPTFAEVPQQKESSAAKKKDDDDDDEEDDNYKAETVTTILKPVSMTMVIVIWAVRTITIPQQSSVISQFYTSISESSDQSTGKRLLMSIVNALIVLAAVLLTTVAFVLLYKYRCLKIIYGWLITASLMMLAMFGGGFVYYLFDAYNIAFDLISFSFLLWNFAVVGIVAIFWYAPTKVNQGYLILISALLAIFFTRFPEWTTFAVLAIIAIYDLVAVLSPCGPLKILVETAQQRQEPIPALLYNASVYMFMADEEPAPPVKKRKGVKLGLGDFIFYSVLIGRAAMFDMITVFTCFVAIITVFLMKYELILKGLFLTLLLLAIFRKALPALPLSVFIGLIFYFLTRVCMLPFVIKHGENLIVM